jgi:stress-induced morphogen
MKNTDKFYVIACLYLDDILILDNNDHMIKSIKKMLTNKFDMKDLGIVDVTRIQISKTYKGLVLSQSHYVEKIHEKRFKGDNSFVKTLIDISIHMSNNRGNGINQLGYY